MVMKIKNVLWAFCFCGMSVCSLEAQQVWTPDNGMVHLQIP